ncbi:MAG: hypothetical protein M0Z49_14975 [Chloroflexi bacterium]|nr:hypothetical protein [Chloroflexota bacterium]
MNRMAITPEAWRARVDDACSSIPLVQLANADAMALALQLAAFDSAEWPDARLPLPTVAPAVAPDRRPDLEYCQDLLALAESPAFDTVVAMFDLVRSVDRAMPSQ